MLKYLFIIFALLLMLIIACSASQQPNNLSNHFNGSHFYNTQPTDGAHWTEIPFIMIQFVFNLKPDHGTPKHSVPVQPLIIPTISHQADQFARLGHSSLLLQLSGHYWLTDPVFSERASPVSWAGPKRFHAPPITIEALPSLTGIIISHNHYDHLDRVAIQQLESKTQRFFVPLGVDQHLLAWGVPKDKIIVLDWWQDQEFAGVKLTATPAQHFSGRTAFDRDETLWASWVIQAPRSTLFFSGDGGYFDGFTEIGNKLGPFDVTFMEAGAYDPRWSGVHLFPEQTVQAHIDLKGHYLMPMHNSTFDLAVHPWYDPFERILSLATQRKVNLLTPEIGELVTIKHPKKQSYWWRTIM